MEKLYAELAHWWPQLRPPEDYDEETAVYLALLMQAAGRDLDSVLELGSAGGHLASNMPEALEVVLVDLSPQMLEASRALNPHREHIQADMRSLRLERCFDAVILHDAVTYMTNEVDLKAALETVKATNRPAPTSTRTTSTTTSTGRSVAPALTAEGSRAAGLEHSRRWMSGGSSSEGRMESEPNRPAKTPKWGSSTAISVVAASSPSRTAVSECSSTSRAERTSSTIGSIGIG